MPLKNKHILLGISGGIAAYKAAELTRLLVKSGAAVQVVMTLAAQEFITPLTLQALSGRAVRCTLFDPTHEAAMGHIELARWAELILIAPASANTLAKLARGEADDLLSTLCLAANCPLVVAPAMNQQMWRAAATESNLAVLRQRKVQILGPANGVQACGDTGPGRMLEPAEILAEVERHLTPGRLSGIPVVITAGPTREAIDPVRYLSNRSSGKMGFALAQAAQEAGADVTLISGPVPLTSPQGVKHVKVESAIEMHTQTLNFVDSLGIFIAAAAVSDYRPVSVAPQKIKKQAETLQLTLVRNPDILQTVSRGTPRPFCVGFAAETHELERFAKNKLKHKQLDMIAANPVNNGLGFDRDDNQLQVYWPGGEKFFPITDKQTLATRLITLITERFFTTLEADAPHRSETTRPTAGKDFSPP